MWGNSVTKLWQDIPLGWGKNVDMVALTKSRAARNLFLEHATASICQHLSASVSICQQFLPITIITEASTHWTWSRAHPSSKTKPRGTSAPSSSQRCEIAVERSSCWVLAMASYGCFQRFQLILTNFNFFNSKTNQNNNQPLSQSNQSNQIQFSQPPPIETIEPPCSCTIRPPAVAATSYAWRRTHRRRAVGHLGRTR